MTDADEIRQKSQQVSVKTDEARAAILAAAKKIDEIKELIAEMGYDAPLVMPFIQLAIDNLGATHHLIGQVTDAIERWAFKV